MSKLEFMELNEFMELPFLNSQFKMTEIELVELNEYMELPFLNSINSSSDNYYKFLTLIFLKNTSLPWSCNNR